MRRALLVAVALVCFAVAAAPADARLHWHRCPKERLFDCAVLRVPLDHSGRVKGTIPLHVARTRRGPHDRALVALSGGPGQGGVSGSDFTAAGLAPARKRYAIVTLDQRGTGDSAPLRCDNLQRISRLNAETAERVRVCAARLGERRGFYSTADTVADLEDLRRALGVPKLAVQGISYGTFVAQQYARTHPERTDRLILDSVVPSEGIDTLLRDSYARYARLMAEQCAGGGCRDITPDYFADVRSLSSRLEITPLRGGVLDSRGRLRTVRLGAVGLNAMVLAGDLNPHLQAALPAAVHSALAGDAAPLLRLVPPAIGPATPLRDLSEGLNVSTSCDDTRLSYPIDSPVAERPAQIAAALAGANPADLGPFSPRVAELFSVDEECRLFPPTTTTAPSSAPLPDVPALVLDGRLDFRTPLENGQEVAGEMPRAQVVTVAGTGHDELDSDISGCVQRALRRFFTDKPVGDACAKHSNQLPNQPVAPQRLADLRPVPGTPGDRGRVLRAVVGTINDAREASYQYADAGFTGVHGAGLRAGTWRLTGDNVFILRGVSWAPGVHITGAVVSSVGVYQGAVRVRAPHGLDGTLRFRPRRGVTGRLGGRRVHLAARYARGSIQRSLLGVQRAAARGG